MKKTFYLAQNINTKEVQLFESEEFKPRVGHVLPWKESGELEGDKSWKVVKIFSDEILRALRAFTMLDDALAVVGDADSGNITVFLGKLVGEVSEVYAPRKSE